MTLLGATELRYAPVGWEALVARPEWLTAVMVGLALAVTTAAFACWRERAGLPAGGWLWLLALRLLALGGLVLAVVGIERREATEQTDPSRVVLLVDASSSMGLPQSETEGLTRGDAAVATIGPLRDALSSDHEVRVGLFGETVRYLDDDVPLTDLSQQEYQPTDTSTALGDALRRALNDHVASPLAGIVVLSDGGSNRGAEPNWIAASSAERGAPIHTIGFGPLSEPPNLALRDLASPSRVFSRDRIAVSVAAIASGYGASARCEVTLRLRPLSESGAASEVILEETRVLEPATADATGPAPQLEANLEVLVFDLESPPPGRYLLEAEVWSDRPDSQPEDNRLEAELVVIDRPTRVLIVAGGPSRDYRFLRDQLKRDESFSVDVMLQSTTGAVSQDADNVLDAFPDTAEAIERYDAIVTFDADWLSLGEPAQETTRQWIARRGGALVFFAGGVNTPEWVRRDRAAPLGKALPVTLRDDPLAATLDGASVNEASPVRLTQDGLRADFLRLTAASAEEDWGRFAGFYADPIPAQPKLGATVYARLGPGPIESAPPLLVEQLYGAGRVVYFAAAQTWRLRSVDTEWFNALHTKLLRHASQGRLLGGAGRGSLYFERSQYEVGDRMTLRLNLRSGEADEQPPRLLWNGPSGELITNSLKSDPAQPGVFTTTHDATTPGDHTAIVEFPNETDGTGRLEASAKVTLPTRESATTLRVERILREVAAASGGTYWSSPQQAVSEIARATPSRAEIRTTLGPPDAEFGEAVSRWSLALVAGGLLLEWILRRLWRLA